MSTYELVDLFEYAVHVVQSGCADEVVEVLSCHPAQEVSFTEFNHRCCLQVAKKKFVLKQYRYYASFLHRL